MVPSAGAAVPAAALPPPEPPVAQLPAPQRTMSLAELSAQRPGAPDLPFRVAQRGAEMGTPSAMGDRILDTVARMRQQHQAEVKDLAGATTRAEGPAPGPAAAPMSQSAAVSERFTAAMTRIMHFNASLLQFSVASSAVSSAGHSFNQFIRGQ